MPLTAGQVITQTHDGTTVDQRGTAYVGNMEYTTAKGIAANTKLDKILNAEGYVTTVANPQYFYFRRDHLGTNREVWSFPASGGSFLEQVTQYYPSGLPWSEGRYAETQNRKYNGKEFVEAHGYDTYDYGARGYYPAIMRFTTVDPLAEKYYGISPYAYCAGNPVNRIDPTGMDWFQNNQTGAVIYFSNLYRGAEEGMVEGWEWMGGNNMFMSDKNDFANADQKLIFENGGNVNLDVKNPLTREDDQLVYSLIMEGDKAKKFMSDRGYEQLPSQQTIWTLYPDVEMNNAPRNPTIDMRINERFAYYKKGSVETGLSAQIPAWIVHTQIGTETISRYSINYSSSFYAKLYINIGNILNGEGSSPLKGWPKYRNNIDLVNKFKRKYGTK